MRVKTLFVPITLSLLAACHKKPKTTPAPLVPGPVVTVATHTEVIDLATAPGSYSVTRRSGIDSVTLIDLAPARTYAIDVAVAQGTVAPLVLPGSVPAGGLGSFMVAPPLCADANKVAVALNSADDERAVASLLQALRDLTRRAADLERKLATPSATAADTAEYRLCPVEVVRDMLLNWMAVTTRTFAVADLGDQDDLRVSVARLETAPDSVHWLFAYNGRRAGEWRTFYSFLVGVNNWPTASYDYFTEQVTAGSPATTTYTVQRRRADDYMFAPGFQYLFDRGKAWSFSPTAGIGIDLTNPSVFAGLALTYRQNIALSAGGMVFRGRSLDPRYAVGQSIETSLDSEQLTRDAFRIKPFIAVSFRFGTSPFAIISGSDKPEK